MVNAGNVNIPYMDPLEYYIYNYNLILYRYVYHDIVYIHITLHGIQ